MKKRCSTRLYVIKFWLPEGVRYKVGYTSKTVPYRLMQILTSFILVHGYSPKAKIVKDEPLLGAYAVEQLVHKQLGKYRCAQDSLISGGTEFFSCTMEEIDVAYAIVSANNGVPIDIVDGYVRTLLY